MGLTSKEVGMIVIEIGIAVVLWFLGPLSHKFLVGLIRESLPSIFIMIVLLVGLVLIINKKMGEMRESLSKTNKGLSKYEENQNNLEKSLKRAEDLIEIKAENKYIKDKLFKLKERFENNGG